MIPIREERFIHRESYHVFFAFLLVFFLTLNQTTQAS